MASSGPLYPSTLTTAAVAPYSNNTWTSVENMGADDGVYASVTSSTYDTNDWTYRARLSNFGFAIPVDATIDGITVEIEGYGANGASSPQHVQLTTNGIAANGDDKGSATSWGASVEVRTFGGAADLWGAAWTYPQINATTFGVWFANKATGNDADFYIDYVRVTVDYTEAGGGASFQSAWTRNSNSVLKVM